MSTRPDDQSTVMQLLERMFEVEISFVKSDANNVEALNSAFHRDVVVHEPASLPYAGDWRGLEGVGVLFQRMREVWSEEIVAALGYGS